jgi:hypothetical protein
LRRLLSAEHAARRPDDDLAVMRAVLSRQHAGEPPVPSGMQRSLGTFGQRPVMIRDHEMAASVIGGNGRLGAVVPLCRTLSATLRHKHTFKHQ